MKTIEYFFDCYFNMSADYNEIEKLVKEFKHIEAKKYVVALEKELMEVIKSENWKAIIEIAHNKGGRILSNKKAEMFSRFLYSLVKGDTNINIQDLYKYF
ncbi:hypothetical protein [Vallitalea guaymasensis]|mgnify:CR=1 FL=1|uniref:hypothetical protein n=1 Tax=Vallitalea guaymasensis TaxID=1185412 RepID=UPI00235527D2|nr:hypothetical protein [Vallitalea guaymasensis]